MPAHGACNLRFDVLVESQDERTLPDFARQTIKTRQLRVLMEEQGVPWRHRSYAPGDITSEFLVSLVVAEVF